MQAGDIVFVRSNTILAKIIRFFDKGKFNHVSIAISNTHILEARGLTKSRTVPFYYEDYEIVDLGLTDSQRERVQEISPSLVGKWYDYFQIIGYIFKGDWNNPNHLICSELVATILSDLDLIENSSEVINATPNELYKLLKERFSNESSTSRR